MGLGLEMGPQGTHHSGPIKTGGLTDKTNIEIPWYAYFMQYLSVFPGILLTVLQISLNV